MALRATIYKIELHLADMNRHHYATYPLTLARHPSETEERLMIRVLAFALNAHENLSFTKGISDSDEPDLWRKDLTGAIECWIEVGLPDERRLIKAAGKADQVKVYCYNGSASRIWLDGIQNKLNRFKTFEITNIPADSAKQLAALANRNMTLHISIQEHMMSCTTNEQTVDIPLEPWISLPT